MSATVRIPSPLLSCTNGEQEVPVRAGSVAEALRDVVRHHPRLRRHIFTESGSLRGFVNVFVNDRPAALEGPEACVSEGDTIVILPSIAGG